MTRIRIGRPRGEACRLVRKVNVLGTIAGDRRRLATIRDGDPIAVDRA